MNIPSSSKGLPRALEVVIALLGLIAISPVMLIAALAIAVTSPGPILFRQQRMGRNGQLFTLYKLRTMCLIHSGPQVTSNGDCRITAAGRILRHSKLDEAPELWNVVKGDMALVGPRPEVPAYVDLKNGLWRQVLEARPGLTDPVTLVLRNEGLLLSSVAEPEKFYLQYLQPYKLRGYIAYLERCSWRSDLAVLWQTIVAVIMPRVSPPPSVEEICGSTPADANPISVEREGAVPAACYATKPGVQSVSTKDVSEKPCEV